MEAIISNDDLSLCIDVGKSGSRGLLTGAGLRRAAEFAGIEPDTAVRPGAAGRLLAVAQGIWAEAVRGHGDEVAPDRLGTLVIGSTSIPPVAEVEAVLDGARRAWPRARVAVVEDGVLGHAAALGGPGNYLSIGTGVIGNGMDGSGRWFRKDGWGPDLGDRGSALWLGRAGLIAALRAADGAGPGTALRGAAQSFLGGLDHAAAARLAGRTDRIAAISSFAQAVCAAAASDDIARGLVADAAGQVASTASALARDTGIDEVAVGGRLPGEPAYRAALDAALAGAGLRRVDVTIAPWEVSPAVLFSPAYAGVATGLRTDSADAPAAAERQAPGLSAR